MTKRKKARQPPVEVLFQETGAPVTASAGVVLVLQMLSAKRALPRPEGVELFTGQGWLEGQHVLAVVLLNVLGLDRVEDVERLEADAGLCRLVRRYEKDLFGVGPRWFERRFRGGRKRTFPSARSLHEWLARRHDEAAGRKRVRGRGYVPRPGAELLRVSGLSEKLLAELAEHREARAVTLDVDATIVSSGKREAQFTYRAATGEVSGEKGYQPVVVYCRELGAVVHTEFRDGNVPAKKDLVRVVEEALRRLPECVEEVTVRMDSAGYQHRLVRYCNDPGVRAAGLERFGVLRLVCGVSQHKELLAEALKVPEAEWKTLEILEKAPGAGKKAVGAGKKKKRAGKVQMAEVPFVPSGVCRHRDRDTLRYLAVRRAAPGDLGLGQNVMPARGGRPAMRVRLLFTNIPSPEEKAKKDGERRLPPESGGQVLALANGRCGEGEEIHSILKRDLSGGMMPSGKFGANACWWELAALSHNLLALLRVCGLGKAWLRVRMKRLRAVFIRVGGRVVRRARREKLVIRGTGMEPFRAALERLAALPRRC